jgi:hypothetical protein
LGEEREKKRGKKAYRLQLGPPFETHVVPIKKEHISTYNNRKGIFEHREAPHALLKGSGRHLRASKCIKCSYPFLFFI